MSDDVPSPASELTVELLGPPRTVFAGRPLALSRLRTRALLYFLAAEAGPHSREQLLGLFWPQLDGRRGRRQLSDALVDLRRAVGADAIAADPDCVRWRGSPADSARFAAHLARAGRLEGADAAAELTAAIGLYRGEFLAGVSLEGAEEFEEWAEERRSHLSLEVLAACARLARLRIDLGDPAGATEVAARGIYLDSLREDLRRC